MQDYHSKLSLLIACFCLSSCASEINDAILELNNPVSTRMNTTNVEEWEYQVDITVNSETPQTFRFDSDETNLSVAIAGVRTNEQNSIEILWHAIINGTEVELSQQSQVFFADGNTVIDAPHTHEQFDSDGDGASNLFELAAGTCIWAVTDPCTQPELTDTNTNNILLNGDFSNGSEHWWSTLNTEEVFEGELCMGVMPMQNFWNLGQLNAFSLERNTRYSLSFYARAETLSEINVSITLPDFNFFEVFTNDFEVFSTFNQYNFQFDMTNRDYSSTGFVFNIDPAVENTFCFDDVVLEKMDSE